MSASGAAPVTSRPIAIYYEHPDWFRPLFAELDRREAMTEKDVSKLGTEEE